MEIILSTLISGLLATSITLIYTHRAEKRSFRIKIAIRVVEECDKLLKIYYKLKSSNDGNSIDNDFSDFMSVYNEFSGDVTIELAYGKKNQLEKYRIFRTDLLETILDMKQNFKNRVDRKVEERISTAKTELYDALIK